MARNPNFEPLLSVKIKSNCLLFFWGRPKPIPPWHKTNTSRKQFSPGINVRANTCGACIRTCANTRKYYRGIIFEICARTFANMYSHLRPLPLYGYSGCVHTHLVPIHENISGAFVSVQKHVAHVFARGRMQEIFLANYLCIGFAPGGIVPIFSLVSGRRPKACLVAGQRCPTLSPKAPTQLWDDTSPPTILGVLERSSEEIHRKSPAFFNAKFPGKFEKK